MRGSREKCSRLLWPVMIATIVFCMDYRATAGSRSTSDSGEQYFAQMVDGGGYVTQIFLVNLRETDIVARLESYKSDGTPFSVALNGVVDTVFSYVIKGRGSLALKTSGTGTQIISGWVQVKANGPLGGSLIYRYSSGGKPIAEVGLNPSTPVTQFCFALDTRDRFYSGLAVANPNNTPIDILFTLYDAEGNRKGQTGQRLEANNHISKLTEEIFPFQNLKNFTGTITAFSMGGAMVATTLRFDQEVNTMASIPVIVEIPIVFTGHNNFYASDDIVGDLRWVPAGTFDQGTLLTETGRDPDEGPQFRHTLTRNLAVMETEVTRRMWADLKAKQKSLPADPSYFDSSDLMAPVDRVSWPTALLFANLLSQHQGLRRVYYADAGLNVAIDATNYQAGSYFADWSADGYRLPTEGEWEYFTRAGTAGPFSIEEPAYNLKMRNSCVDGVLTALESAAWYCANASTKTHKSGNKTANPWNLKDLHGNVMEWCWDWYADHYPSTSQTDYRGPASGLLRVLRSGSWGNSPRNMRSASRFSYDPLTASYHIGFRLIRSM